MGFSTVEFVPTHLSEPNRTTLIDNGLFRWRGVGVIAELKSFFRISKQVRK